MSDEPLRKEPFLPDAACRERTPALQRALDLSEQYGMRLSGAQVAMLAKGRAEALQSTGRIEFGEGVLPRLMESLCDSPFIQRDEYADTLLAMQALFYEFKNESGDAFSDEELIAALTKVFGGRAQGSIAYLEGLSASELYRLATSSHLDDDGLCDEEEDAW